MQSFIHVTDEATDFFQAVQGRERFRLRAAAIVAASCGSVLNFLLLFVCMMGGHDLKPPRILTGCAYIPVRGSHEAHKSGLLIKIVSQLILSLAWDHLDLASRRILKLDIPPPILACVDGLGFLGFLAIIITNAVVCSDMYYGGGIVVLLVYNSVFWIVCWYVHYDIC